MERILIEALDLMELGVGIEEIVSRYPDQAAELRPFLMTARSLSDLASEPTLAAQAASKRAFLAAADSAGTVRARPTTGGWLRRLALPLAALLMVVVIGGAGLARASGSAVPGDALYETKRLVEDVRLNLSTDPERAAALRERYHLERVREIEQLLADGRAADVSLTGHVDAMTGDRWQVDGVPVVVSAATVIDGLPVVGALVQVDGRTGDEGIAAGRIMVLSTPALPDPTPQPAPTAITPTPRPSATTPADDNANGNGDDNANDNGDDNANDNDDDNDNAAPGAGQPPGGAIPVAPSASPTPAPTTPPPAPTVAPTPTPPANDNGNDNDDDNANDNGNDNDDDNENDNGNDNGDDNGDDNGGGGDDGNDNGGGDGND